jgi:hypothetical protein
MDVCTPIEKLFLLRLAPSIITTIVLRLSGTYVARRPLSARRQSKVYRLTCEYIGMSPSKDMVYYISDIGNVYLTVAIDIATVDLCTRSYDSRPQECKK